MLKRRFKIKFLIFVGKSKIQKFENKKTSSRSVLTRISHLTSKFSRFFLFHLIHALANSDFQFGNLSLLLRFRFDSSFLVVLMMGKGVSRERFQPKTCSGKKRDLKNIVFIDVDSDQVDDVVIIDFPEFMSKLHGSGSSNRERVSTPQSVISIDDDDDEESDDAGHPGTVPEGFVESDSDASSSKRFSSDKSGGTNCVHIDVDDSGVCEKDFVSDVEKRREACSAKGTSRNCYGLGGYFESSDSECSDCELMEREQWEKSSAKRKHGTFNDRRFYDENASSSGLHCDGNVYIDVDVEIRTEQNAEGAAYSGRTNSKYAEQNQSVEDDCDVDGNFNPREENSVKDSDQKVEQGNCKSHRFESSKEETQSFHSNYNIERAKRTSMDFSPSTPDENSNFCSGVSRSKKNLGGKKSKFVNMSQKACERHDLGKDDNISEANFKSVSVDGRGVNCDGLVINAQSYGLTSSSEKDIINEKEKLKETNEYKQAMEEEWASRQQQLKIQAEEAQRLRKRKKAESQRLLDMQRRQKERIEEVRETQKKDEECMNLKEQLRVEIRKGLSVLEMQCKDMASLLRGLGIQVGGSFNPLPNEVHAAYKRALFKFHPDRASKTDIRAQVEAEEKFKLISRMKEKFLLTSCH
ncbi:hypothetical protein RJT34_07022 [Clitoria ternatea]|uniref:J domain-containing protein n=1 Tax=Clitoria ternatea TaxID=43366 RepID=A0AAN9K400_CLITE